MKVNNPGVIKFPCIVSRDEWDFWSKKANSLGYVAYSGRNLLKCVIFEEDSHVNRLEVFDKYFADQKPKRLLFKKLDS